jgi:hypothetical protein
MDSMRKKELQVKVSFEPNRLAEVYMANAYEKIIPIIKQPVSIQEKTDISIFKIPKRRRG